MNRKRKKKDKNLFPIKFNCINGKIIKNIIHELRSRFKKRINCFPHIEDQVKQHTY